MARHSRAVHLFVACWGTVAARRPGPRESFSGTRDRRKWRALAVDVGSLSHSPALPDALVSAREASACAVR